MLNFIIQVDKENGMPINDFTYQAYEAIKFMNWVYSHELEPIYAHCQFACLEQLQKWEGDVYEHHIPVGTIEFVHTYMEKIGKEIPKPINVPESLFDFAGRRIVNGSISSFNSFKKEKDVYVKSNDEIKDDDNDLYSSQPHSKGGSFQMSDWVSDIEKEFRLFIFNNEIRGISLYRIDNEKENMFNPYVGLDKVFCEKAVEAYQDSPIAYTLDIGIRSNGENLVIECHNFYSCGIYGWSNYAAYINMITGWWKQWLSQKK